MRCEVCQGTGTVKHNFAELGTFTWPGPCACCGGDGIAYCCEGSERHGQLPGKRENKEVKNVSND